MLYACGLAVFNFNFFVRFQNLVHVCVYFQVTFLPEKERKQLVVSHCSLCVTL